MKTSSSFYDTSLCILSKNLIKSFYTLVFGLSKVYDFYVSWVFLIKLIKSSLNNRKDCETKVEHLK